jgi:autoinducer 2 (AI-2) kinase
VTGTAAPLLVALDAGGASGRCVVFDARGRVVSAARRSWKPIVPEEVAPWGCELEADATWETLAALARDDPARVAAVSATAQRIACAFVDARGDAIYVGPNRDVRGMFSDLAVDSVVSEDAFWEITRHWPPGLAAPARLCWFKAHAPARHARIARVLSLSDWLLLRLSGEFVAEPTSADALMLLDVAAQGWSPAIAAGLGLPPGAFPPLKRSGDVIGRVTHAAASATGLPEGVPVVVGGGDSQCALLASAVCEPGRVGVIAGSSTPVMLVTDRPLADPEGNLWTGCHVFPDRWLLEANAGDTGSLHAWVLETFAPDVKAVAAQGGDDPYALYDEIARRAEAGCGGVTCHLGPRRFNLRDLNTARPAGLLMRFGDTTLAGPERPALLRAFYENCAYAVRANLERIEAVSGTRVPEVVMSGGMSRSALYGNVLATVLGRPVHAAACFESSALGAAICAAVGAGLAPTLDEGARRMTAECGTFAPDPEDREAIEDGYERWTEREANLESF